MSRSIPALTRGLCLLALLAVRLAMAATVHGAQAKGPVQVYILAGQSNMDGQAHVRTIDFLGEDDDPARAALLKTFKPDGTNLVSRSDVWVASGGYQGDLVAGLGGRKDYTKPGSNIGPEYSFGYFMGEACDEQVLLIKYGPGGTSLLTAWRPPSAGPTSNASLDAQELDDATVEKWFHGRKGKVVGCQYRYLVHYVQDTLADLKTLYPAYDEKAGYRIAGLVWFQGYNDLGCTKEDYGQALACLIKDLRRDLEAPDMKAVVGVLGVNGPKNEGGKQVGVREGQRYINTVPEFQGNARAIESAPLLHPLLVAVNTQGWLPNDRDFDKQPITAEEKEKVARATSNKGFHYYGEGRFFILLGKAFADTMLELTGRAQPAAARP